MPSTTAPQGPRFIRAGDFARVVTPADTRCPDCGGSGLARRQVVENGRTYDVATECGCATSGRRAKRFDAAHVPFIHAEATFDGYRPSNAEQARALQVARDFALGWPRTRGFIISGPVGTGKTHLLAATLKHLTLELGVAAAYVEISLLYAQIRRGFQDGKSGGEIIQPLSRLEVLAIDELGKGRGSQFELETLDELIARRYNAGKVTLFATNYSLRPPEARAQQGYLDSAANLEAGRESKLLSDRVGERIYSRLCEMCDFVELPASTPDARRARASPMRR